MAGGDDVGDATEVAQGAGDGLRARRGVVGVLLQLATDGVRAGLHGAGAGDLLLGLREQEEGAQLGDEVRGVGHDDSWVLDEWARVLHAHC